MDQIIYESRLICASRLITVTSVAKLSRATTHTHTPPNWTREALQWLVAAVFGREHAPNKYVGAPLGHSLTRALTLGWLDTVAQQKFTYPFRSSTLSVLRSRVTSDDVAQQRDTSPFRSSTPSAIRLQVSPVADSGPWRGGYSPLGVFPLTEVSNSLCMVHGGRPAKHGAEVQRA